MLKLFVDLGLFCANGFIKFTFSTISLVLANPVSIGIIELVISLEIVGSNLLETVFDQEENRLVHFTTSRFRHCMKLYQRLALTNYDNC